MLGRLGHFDGDALGEFKLHGHGRSPFVTGTRPGKRTVCELENGDRNSGFIRIYPLKIW